MIRAVTNSEQYGIHPFVCGQAMAQNPVAHRAGAVILGLDCQE
jgi:hypothetical protein